MKYILAFLLLTFGSSFSQANRSQDFRISCDVVNLVDSEYFDTSLQQKGDGDEDHDSVDVIRKNDNLQLKIGGIRYPSDIDESVEMRSNTKKLTVYLTSGDYEDKIIFSIDKKRKRGLLGVSRYGKIKLIAVTQCH